MKCEYCGATKPSDCHCQVIVPSVSNGEIGKPMRSLSAEEIEIETQAVEKFRMEQKKKKGKR